MMQVWADDDGIIAKLPTQGSAARRVAHSRSRAAYWLAAEVWLR